MRRITFIYLLLALSLNSIAQVSSLKTAIAATNQRREKLPIEKLYIQTDKPYYTLGDTLRFKAYLLNGDFLTPSTRSGLLYVELDNTAGQMLKRFMLPISSGLAWGDIALDETIPEGSYTLRAYTNWQRNFGEEYIFKKNITISANTGGSTLIRSMFKLTDTTTKSSRIDVALQFINTTHYPWRFKDLQLRVMNGRHSLYHTRANTGVDGKAQLSFELADKTALNNLAITAQQTGKGADTTILRIPVTINRAEKTDVQFMPEGGGLVAGIPARVGFKAVGEDGKAAEITGKIYNSNQQELISFHSTHKGMGNFGFTPLPNETYTARITLANKSTQSYAFPMVNASGIVLTVKPAGNDSLNLTLSATADLLNRPAVYYLLSQARGIICYAQTVNFLNQKPIKITLPKSLFPTGITHFTLLDATGRPLNERIVYIDHNDNLQVTINPDKSKYTTRDSIALAITVKDKDGNPVQGNFSLAVTDDGQVRTDSLAGNILSNLLFTSDLKGVVEEPNWYFENNTTERTTALDNLLLTQGWVGYNWKDVFVSNKDRQVKPLPFYQPEPAFIVTGKVTNVFNKPMEKANVVLLSKKPSLIRDTQTDKNGIFTFTGLFPVDTAMFRLSAHNKSGRDNVGIEMLNEFIPPVFSPQPQQMPWYVNSDTVLLNNSFTKLAQLKAEANFRGEGKMLKEVVIKEKKIVKDSKHLVEPGIYDQVLDEKDMLEARKMTLNDLLQTKVKGFVLIGTQGSYIVDDRLVYFVIDGISLNDLYDGDPYGPTGDPGRYYFLKAYLDFFNAEDIKGIEVMTSLTDRVEYTFKYIPTKNGSLVIPPAPFTFIEITTRSGHGPFMKRSPGSYMYRPMAFTLSKQFYSPKYTIKNKTIGIGTDLRSTIYWEPNIVTDTAGKATISFYSADKPAGYTITTEGTDMNGGLGFKTQKIKILAAPGSAK